MFIILFAAVMLTLSAIFDVSSPAMSKERYPLFCGAVPAFRAAI